jgi:parvulin-like peptidyl-prolyl isomerase
MTIRKKTMVLGCVALALCISLPGAICAEDSEKILVTVGEETISRADIDAKTVNLPPQIRSRFETPAGRKQLLEQVVLTSLLAQEARRLGIDKQDDIVKKIKEVTDNVIVQELNRQIVSREITLSDQEIEKYYNENKEDFVRPEQVNASVIMFKVVDVDSNKKKEKKKLAKVTLDRLKKGADFADVAREVSEDRRTSRRGGVTGFFARDRRAGIYGKKFEEVVFGLETGEISDVFETEVGYFIARVDDRQPRTEKSLNDVKGRIERRLKQIKQREAYQKYVEGLKEKYPVKYSE